MINNFYPKSLSLTVRMTIDFPSFEERPLRARFALKRLFLKLQGRDFMSEAIDSKDAVTLEES